MTFIKFATGKVCNVLGLPVPEEGVVVTDQWCAMLVARGEEYLERTGHTVSWVGSILEVYSPLDLVTVVYDPSDQMFDRKTYGKATAMRMAVLHHWCSTSMQTAVELLRKENARLRADLTSAQELTKNRIIDK